MNRSSETDLKIAFVILTYNEELNLPFALESVRGLATEIFVVDSGSTDKTLEIAQTHGAQVFTHPFTNQAEQFNWALENLPLASDWVFRLDADEYLTPELIKELQEQLPAAATETTGFFLKYRMIFLQRWIRYGGYYPTWLLRIFRRGAAHYERAEMDERLILKYGQAGQLENDFIHDDRKGLSAWFLKHEGYASRQVRVLERGQTQQDTGEIEPKFWGNQAERKRWLRHKFYGRAPLFTRAFLYFIYRYFLRLGFLDGLPGLIFHFLHAGWYFFYIDAKVYESRLNKSAAATLKNTDVSPATTQR